MHKKEIYTIAIKIIGLIALWKAIMAAGVLAVAFGLVITTITNTEFFNASMIFGIGLSMILNFALPLIVGLLFIFNTTDVLSFLKLDAEGEVPFVVDKAFTYHLAVVVFALMIILQGAGSFINYSVNTSTNSSYTTNFKGSVKHRTEKETVTETKKRDINYFGLIQIIVGLVMLLRAIKISEWIRLKYDHKLLEIPIE